MFVTSSITSVGDLNTHKHQAHPEVVKATRDKAAKAKEARLQLATETLRRKREAGLVLSRKVITGYGGVPYYIADLSGIDAYDATRARYPEPVAFQSYLDTTQRIARLQAEAQVLFLQAYTEGKLIPIEDWQNIQDVMKEA